MLLVERKKKDQNRCKYCTTFASCKKLRANDRSDGGAFALSGANRSLTS